jgi:chemotaxis protein methyltransferase CheR
LQILINLLTINETYFFREDYQFKALVNSMLEEIVKTKNKNETVKIWSIPCSTGEEPYSIVIYLLEFWKDIEKYNIEVIASDIDSGTLHKAEKGIYSARSVQNIPQNLLKKYFNRLSLNSYEINRDLRNTVEFTLLNVIDKAKFRQFRYIDIIFCRNMLIYFDNESRKSTLNSFFNAMTPGGFICLGHSEYMSQITEVFKLRNFPDAMVYQKPK